MKFVPGKSICKGQAGYNVTKVNPICAHNHWSTDPKVLVWKTEACEPPQGGIETNWCGTHCRPTDWDTRMINWQDTIRV